MLAQPLTGAQAGDTGFVQTSGSPVIDVLQAGVLAQLDFAQAGLQAPVCLLRDFSVDQKPEAFLEGSCFDVRHRHLLLQRPVHAGEAQRLELSQGRVCQHGALLDGGPLSPSCARGVFGVSVVVVGAAQILVVHGLFGRGGLRQGPPVQALLENRLDALVACGA